MSEQPTQRPDEIAAAVERAIERLDARDKAEQAHDKARAASKERLSDRVSIAAISLTMLLSFLNFARTERDDAGKQLRVDVSRAQRQVDAHWTLYHARASERDGYARSEDQLTREVATLGPDDPRLRLAELNHVEYAQRIASLDDDNRRVFYVIEDLERKQVQAVRTAEHIDAKIARYDMGTRVLTLALVILSLTLLANQRHLFSASVLLAFIGAAIAVSGYFMR
ncbi:MAG: DUF4337 family protein [Polyangia bacterium]